MADAIISGFQNEEQNHIALVAIDKIEIDNIDKDGEKYIICMKINTQQINYTTDKDNNIIDGSKTEIIKVNEKWFFSRKISSKNQTWFIEKIEEC